jgi:hypothetical protein
MRKNDCGSKSRSSHFCTMTDGTGDHSEIYIG